MSSSYLHIKSSIDAIMGRGRLPARVMVAESGGGAFFGDIFAWDEQLLGYTCPDRPDIVANAEFVRTKWGRVFCSVPAAAVVPGAAA